jgi:hypothetical protein
MVVYRITQSRSHTQLGQQVGDVVLGRPTSRTFLGRKFAFEREKARKQLPHGPG